MEEEAEEERGFLEGMHIELLSRLATRLAGNGWRWWHGSGGRAEEEAEVSAAIHSVHNLLSNGHQTERGRRITVLEIAIPTTTESVPLQTGSQSSVVSSALELMDGI